MKAIGYYILVEKIKVEQKKVAGLILTEKTDTDNRYVKAKIISIGNLVTGVKDDDIVFFDKHAGHSIRKEDNLYHVIQIQDIVLVE
jgi:co-chaperonin GroES (HSP10)